MAIIRMEVDGGGTAKDIVCSHCGKKLNKEEYIVLEGKFPENFWLDSGTLYAGSIKKTTVYLCVDCWKEFNRISSENYQGGE